MRKLDYKDISLVPRKVSELDHRSQADTGIDFLGIPLDAPILSAPMPDVCNGQMAHDLKHMGCLGVIHRFQSIEEQKNEYFKSTLGVDRFKNENPTFCAIGTTGDWLERFCALNDMGCQNFCIDTANGANKQIEKIVNHLNKSDNYIIAGNVASWQCFKYLADLGVDAIRCGIAGGSVCETKTETGVYYPMFSLLQEIKEHEPHYSYPSLIIADGGIKSPSDIAKAMVFADVVMIGGLFSACKESPAKVLNLDGKLFKVLRGAASFSVQQEFKDEPKYVEGRETLIPYYGPLSDLTKRIRNGLQSSMSYMNSKDWDEFKENVDWIQV